MAGCVDHVEAQAFDFDAVPIRNPHRDHVDTGLFAHHRDAMDAVAQRAEPGNVIGVQMGVDGFDQPEIQFAHQLEVAVDLLQHRIDDQRLAAGPAGENIGVSAGRAVEQLTEDHRAPLLMSNLLISRVRWIRLPQFCRSARICFCRAPCKGGVFHWVRVHPKQPEQRWR